MTINTLPIPRVLRDAVNLYEGILDDLDEFSALGAPSELVDHAKRANHALLLHFAEGAILEVPDTPAVENPPVQVGDTAGVERENPLDADHRAEVSALIERLPAGSKFKDNDGDVWTVLSDGDIQMYPNSPHVVESAVERYPHSFNFIRVTHVGSGE